LNTGMARGLCARVSPLGSSSSQAKSWDSLMISENAVRHTVSHISSTTVISRDHMISSPIGSASMRAHASCSGRPAVTRGAGAATSPSAMRRFMPSSTARLSPGGTMVVDSRSSTMAGPSMRSPGRSA
jgi:hypothetical protein